MQWKQVEGRWTRYQTKARRRWSKLSDEDWDQIGGRRDALVARVQATYGDEREAAERQIDEWLKTLDDDERQPRH